MQLKDLAATLLAREVATLEGEDPDVVRVLDTRARDLRYALDVSARYYRKLEKGAREAALKQVGA
jgi:hypothetical protein